MTFVIKAEVRNSQANGVHFRKRERGRAGPHRAASEYPTRPQRFSTNSLARDQSRHAAAL
jgi:hypothetical protein